MNYEKKNAERLSIEKWREVNAMSVNCMEYFEIVENKIW